MPGQNGGRRPGAGRPLGSKNKIPRYKRAKDRLNEIVTEIEGSEYLSTNDKKQFEGNAGEFLYSVVKCERLPVKVRIYAAAKLVDFEPKPEGVAGRSGAVLILPSNGRDLDLENRQWISCQLDKLAAAERVEEEERYRRDPDAVRREREAEAEEWERDHPRSDVARGDWRNPAPVPVQSIVPPVETVAPKPAPNGHAEISRVLFTTPSREFWINGRIAANEFGEIDISKLDPVTVELLIRQGCRKQR